MTRILTAAPAPALLLVLGLLGLAACGSSDNTPTPAPAAEPAPAAPATTIADELAIDEVGVYQGTKSVIVKEGELRTPEKINAPIIAGRPALIRVFVKAIGRTRPEIQGELRVKRAGKEDLVLKDGGKRVVPELDEELLENTLNFEIAAEDMTADATFSVRAGLKLDGPDVVAFPADGSAASFGAKTASQKLKVKFVPVSYEAELGSSITPDLADLSSLKDTLYKMYPVASVDVSVRAPMKWSTPVKSNGPGWDELLTGIMQLRRADNVERDVYYVGVFTPKASIDQFCNQGGCILGIAPQADERSVNMRVALVLGYKSRGAGSTLAQELAHAMGRAHAPCGSPADIDPDFPYGSGGIGVWGYDLLTKKMIDPGNRYRDFMSYCGPTWVSDYTYKGLYERMELLTKQQEAINKSNPATPSGGGGGGSGMELMQSFRVASDGSIHEGPALDMMPGDDTGSGEVVSYEGANGEVFATAKARVVKISGTGSRIVVAPSAPLRATHARIGSLGVTALRTARATW